MIEYMNLTHQVPMLPSYRNQSIDFQSKSIDWFLYEGEATLALNGLKEVN